jgi:hypothetical protein
MDFIAEIIRTSQKKLVSSDNQYEIVFRTQNPMILDLGKLPSDTLFGVRVTLHDNNSVGEVKEHEQNVGI